MILKRIYLLQHAYVDIWRYVGATSRTYSILGSKFRDAARADLVNTKLYKAFRSSSKSDWSMTTLHSHDENWEELEAEYIKKYDSFYNGLNSTASGGVRDLTNYQTYNKARQQKIIDTGTGIVYDSITEAATVLKLHRPNLVSHLNGRQRTIGGKVFIKLDV